MNLPGEFNTPEFAKGLAKRVEVLGATPVQESLENVNEFTKPIQKFVTEAAWGGIWERDGPDAKSRSMITVGMHTALGRQHELSVPRTGRPEQRRQRTGVAGNIAAIGYLRWRACCAGSLSHCRCGIEGSWRGIEISGLPSTGRLSIPHRRTGTL